MPDNNLTILTAFGAGLLSFFSPCVLPLIPAYLSFLSGAAAETAEPGRTGRLFLATLCFMLGFSLVFILLSLLFSGSLILLGGVKQALNIAAGSIIVLLGLHVWFGFLPFLNYEKRLHIKERPRSWLEALVTGLAFGAGWTPCVGPILGGILVLAGQTGSLPRSALYLAVYSLGLGLPFLLAAVFSGACLQAFGRLRKYLPVLQALSGLLLIGIGGVILFKNLY
ncbi:MAG: cytochrome c biogenesis protein CcdA [Candidatus Margulisbacteria bacterium]|jgi:cytochrome c-type biogenesis protein|nr:cytochrome c biogenesis protein CcdA [Candidatus Margulisiibacteriota bacterium]